MIKYQRGLNIRSCANEPVRGRFIIIQLFNMRITYKIYQNYSMQSLYHPSQTRTLSDKLVIVDKSDNEIGVLDKKTCHEIKYINNNGYPHRAFSLFLFNKENQLLMHRRSALKIIFPLAWTNSCCSHPSVLSEEGSTFVQESQFKAVVRRTMFELGINIEKEPLYLIDKILYKSQYNQTWGEYELDYVFFSQLNQRVQFDFNREEIAEIQWVSFDRMDEFIEKKQKEGQVFSPWFIKIYKSKLKMFWNYLIANDHDKLKDAKVDQVNQL